MNYVKICQTLGNGQFDRGKAVLDALAGRMLEARAKHPVFAEGVEHAAAGAGEAVRMQAGANVVAEECLELLDAARCEGEARARDEALDVMVTAARLWAGEWREKDACR